MKNKIESLQILRGLAALSVVLYHYNLYLAPNGQDRAIPDMLFGWGAIGVDLFFVISGFIMVYVTYNRPPGMSTSFEFVINRLVRVLPTYYAILFLTLLSIGSIGVIFNLESDPNIYSALTFQPYINDTAPLYVPGSGLYNIRWTLNYELYFYIAFAVCLIFKPRIAILSIWFIAPMVIAYSMTNNFTLSTHGYELGSTKLRFITNPIIFEFGIGVLAGMFYFKLKENRYLSSGFISLSCFISVAFLIATGSLKAYSIISAIAFFFVVLFFSIQSDKIVKITPRFFIVLGNISFSWYLIHTPLLYIASLKFDKYYPGAINSFSGFGILLALSIFLAWISHRYLEIVLTRKIKTFITNGFYYKSKA